MLHDKTTKLVSGIVISDSLYGIKMSDDTSKYLKSGFLTGNIEVAWRKKYFDVGIDLQMPLTNQSAVAGTTINALNSRIFFRYRIK